MVQRTIAPTHSRSLFGGRVWSLLAASGRRAEPVDLVEQRFNFLPHSFRWRGDLRRVRLVARVWEQHASGIRAPRRYFEVIFGQGGSYVLFQDLKVGTWHVSL